MGKLSTPPVLMGYNYSASVALLHCMGQMCGIYQIFAADEQIWPTTGDPTIVGQALLNLASRLSCTEASNAGRSYSVIQTSIGTMRFYWGFPNSAIDPALAAIASGGVALGTPGYRNFCYSVWDDMQFGQSQSPPNITIVGDMSMDEPGLISQWPWRWRYKTAWTPDAYFADIVASWLTNPIYGAGLDLSLLDQTSFLAANHDSDTEGSGLSPSWSNVGNLRSLLGDLLPYYNAYLYFDNGKIYLQIPRPPTGAVPTLDMSMMTEEPEIVINTYINTWNETRVAYTDRTMQFQTLVENYDDAANMEIVGRAVQKQIDRKFISRQDLAQRTAETVGKLNGVPSNSVTLVLRSILTNLSAEAVAAFPASMQLDAATIRCAGFVPGQLIALNYPPRNIVGMQFRISKVTIGAPGDGIVTLEGETDASITGTTSLYSPSPATATRVDQLGPDAAVVRIAALTAEQLDGDPDGVLACVARPNALISSYEVDANWEETTDFTNFGVSSAFAILGSLNRWRRSDNTGRVLVDVTISTALDQAKLTDYSANKAGLYFVAMNRMQTLLTAVDQHQLIPCWSGFRVGGRFALVSANRWEIEIEPGAFGSVPFSLEDFRAPAAGYWPTSICWIGTQSDFFQTSSSSLKIFTAGGNDPSDAAENRLFRFPTSTPNDKQDITDATEVMFERLVPTMNPGGTFVPDWGARATNAEYVTLVANDGATEYWRLAELSGTAATNHIDSGNDGTYLGGFTLGTATPLTLEVSDASTTFNGTTALVAVTNNTPLKLSTGSLELWLKTLTPGSGRRGLAIKLGAYGLYLYDGVPGWRDWSGSVTDHIASASLADNVWHHLVLTFQSAIANGVNLYVDGALVLTATMTVRDQLSTFVLACEKDQSSAASQFYAGALDEVALYPTALDIASVQSHHAAALGAW